MPTGSAFLLASSGPVQTDQLGTAQQKLQLLNPPPNNNKNMPSLFSFLEDPRRELAGAAGAVILQGGESNE